MIKGRPFVKWAGGKRQIIDKLKQYVPDDFNTYYEPFIGGGALLFELSPKKAVINDSNKELINVYECIKDEKKFEAMCRELNHHETEHSEEYYYKIRNLDRDKNKFNKLVDYKRAARTIYLNKACYNGLYRVNSKNEFNVPFGKKTKVNTYEGQNLGIICGYLNYNDVKLLSVDFEEAVKDAELIVVLTDHNEFKVMDEAAITMLMKEAQILDTKNCVTITANSINYVNFGTLKGNVNEECLVN